MEISDLYDPATRPDALRALADGDLVLAALAQNETPIYPGLDHQRAAENLAELFLHASTPHGAETLARAATAVVDPAKVCETTALHLGWEPPSDILGRNASWALFLAAHPTGIVLLRAALVQMFTRQYNTLPPSYDWTIDVLAALAALVDDPAPLAAAARSSNDYVAAAATRRLVNLGITEACDVIVLAGTGTPKASTAVALSGASLEALEAVVDDPAYDDLLRERARYKLDTASRRLDLTS